MINNLLANNVKSIKITREETENTESQFSCNKYITLRIVLTDENGKELTLTAFSKSHDNWTDATKELEFNRMFPNNIIIEHTDEDPFREPITATVKPVTENEPLPF